MCGGTAMAAWGDGGAVLKSARISSRDPGVEVAEEIDKAFTANLAAALGLHRAWDRGRQSHVIGRPTRRLTIAASTRGSQLRKLGRRE